MARYLFDQGADPDSPQALHDSFFKNPDLFNLLWERYFVRYPAGRGTFGSIVLYYAVFNENREIIRQMLQKRVNAEIMLYSHYGLEPKVSPFGSAIMRQNDGDTRILELFLQHGCDPNSIVLQTDPTFSGGYTQWSPRVTIRMLINRQVNSVRVDDRLILRKERRSDYTY